MTFFYGVSARGSLYTCRVQPGAANASRSAVGAEKQRVGSEGACTSTTIASVTFEMRLRLHQLF